MVDITEAVDTVLDKVSEYDVTIVTLQETVSTLGNTLDTVQADYMFVETKALEMDIRITETIDKVTDLEEVQTGHFTFLCFVIRQLSVE